MQSGLFKLNLLDFGKGLIMAVLAPVLTAIANSLGAGIFPTGADFHHYLLLGLAVGVSYLTKNFFSPGTTPPVTPPADKQAPKPQIT
jgi:hypothetical protein